MFETGGATAFGGGLAFDRHPAALNPDEWSFANGFVPKQGCAEVDVGWVQQLGAIPDDTTLLGLAPDPFTRFDILMVLRDDLNGNAVLIQIESGLATPLVLSGTAPTAGVPGASPIQAAFSQGELVIACGIPASGNYSLLRLDQTGTYRRIAPTMALRSRYVVAVAGHLVTGYRSDEPADRRGIDVGDAGSLTVWDPDIGNSADGFELSGLGEITGLTAWRDGALALTEDRVYQLASSGGNPPFTVSIAEERGSGVPTKQGVIVGTPYGAFYDGADDIYVMGGPGIGGKVYRYLARLGISGTPAKYLWQPGRGHLLVPGGFSEILGFAPEEKAWYRRTGPAGKTILAHEIEQTRFSWPAGAQWLATQDGFTYREDDPDSPTPFPGAFVDTKDFPLGGDPTRDGYVDRIRVDWEPLSNASTDAIEVLASVRNDFSPLLLGQYGMQRTLSFMSCGVLTAGQSELPVRLRGKYATYRFQPVSGRSRIRGFAYRFERGGDRVASG